MEEIKKKTKKKNVEEAPKLVTEETTPVETKVETPEPEPEIGLQPEAVSGETLSDTQSNTQVQPQPHLVQEEVDSPVQLDEDLEGQSKGKKILKIALVAVLSLAFVAVVSGGVYTYLKGIKKTETPKVESPTPTLALETPSPTPEPEVDLSKFKVNVLNGSGIVGEAGKAKIVLEKTGFTVGNTSNAKSYDFTDTVIQAKKDVSESVIETLKKALSATYSVKVGDNLGEKDTYDIVITVGSKKG